MKTLLIKKLTIWLPRDYNGYVALVAVLYAFSLPLSRALLAFFSALLILMLIVHPNRKAYIQELLDSSVFKVFMLYYIFSLMTLLWTSAPNFHDAFRYIVRMWYILPAFALFVLLPREKIGHVLLAFLFGMIVSETLSFGIFFEFWSINGKGPNDPTPFMHHIIYSTFLTVTSLIVFNKFFDQKTWYLKAFFFLYFLVVTSNLFINGGRTGQLGFIVAMFVLGFMRIPNKIAAFFIIGVLEIAIFWAGYSWSPVFKQRIDEGANNIANVVEHGQYCTSWGVRLALMEASVDIIPQSPIFGMGHKDDMDAFIKIADTARPEFACAKDLPHFHNQYIQTTTQSGILGLLLLLFFLYAVARIPIQSIQLRNIKWIVLSTYLVTFIPEPLFGRQFSLALFGLMLGLLLAQYRSEGSSTENTTDSKERNIF